MALLGGLIHTMSLLQDLTILAIVAIIGCYKSNAAMQVFAVVPVHEAYYPLAGLVDICKTTFWILRAIFQRAE